MHKIKETPSPNHWRFICRHSALEKNPEHHLQRLPSGTYSMSLVFHHTIQPWTFRKRFSLKTSNLDKAKKLRDKIIKAVKQEYGYIEQ